MTSLVLLWLALAGPAGERANLEPRQDVWAEVVRELGPLGQAPEAMDSFGSLRYRLPAVARLFGDVRRVPRFSGLVTDRLLEAADDPAAIVGHAFGLLEARAARDWPGPSEDDWRAPSAAEPLRAGEVLDLLRGFRRPGPLRTAPLAPETQLAWDRLPDALKLLIGRLFLAAVEADPILDEAFDPGLVRAARLGVADPTTNLYRIASSPFREDGSHGRLARRLLDDAHLPTLAFASVRYWSAVRNALRAFRDWRKDHEFGPLRFEPIEIDTAFGPVRVSDTSGSDQPLGAFLHVDLGGNDTYRDAPRPLSAPELRFRLTIEIGGDDRVISTEPASFCCALFGIAGWIDMNGNDDYSAGESGIASAWYGSALLSDEEGRDTYRLRDRWGLGAAHCGVALLVDAAGDDSYECGSMAIGYGGTSGVGILLDRQGNDRYRARLDANPSPAFGNRSVSLAMGCGYGPRGDFSHGLSLAGGIGLLLEARGDDAYEAGVFALGAGYWWGLGIAEDRAGDDRYRVDWYGLGAAAHFAVGCFVDLAGADRYNDDHPNAVTQYLACARDGAMAVFVDGAGDDRYLLRNRCGGAGDLASVAWFWECAGDDRYAFDPADPYEGDSALPSVTYGPLTRTFRDEMVTRALFLDEAGSDVYPEGRWGNAQRWKLEPGGPARALGWDR